MTEIERLRHEVDRLTARSWVQEALVLFLAQRAGADEFGFVFDAEAYAGQLKEHLRHSSLTDAQFAQFDSELRGLLERLHRLGEKPDPADAGPDY